MDHSIHSLNLDSLIGEVDDSKKREGKVTFGGFVDVVKSDEDNYDDLSQRSDSASDLDEDERDRRDMEKIMNFEKLLQRSREDKRDKSKKDRFMESSPNLSMDYHIAGSSLTDVVRSNSFSSFSNLETTRDSFEAIKEEAALIKESTCHESWKPRAPINIFDDDSDYDED